MMSKGAVMKIISGFLACLIAAPACAQSLCAANETMIFTCPAKPKVVSVCASKDLGPQRGYLHFRIGSEGRTETIYPAGRAPNAITYGYAGVGQGPPGHYIMLKRGRDVYGIITTDSRGPQYGGEATAFVRQRDGKLAEALQCDDLTDVDSGSELLGKAGFPDVDSGELVLP